MTGCLLFKAVLLPEQRCPPSKTLKGQYISCYQIEQDAVVLRGTNPFRGPHFLFVGSRLHSASMTFPEFQRAGRTVSSNTLAI